MNEATLQYVRQHADDDVRMLALAGSKAPGVDLNLALQQIQGRQTARRKLPSWAALDEIIYPPHLSMEQCSSEPTGRYKAALAARLLADEAGKEGGSGQNGAKNAHFIDLTGGFGVDFSFLAPLFSRATYVEQQAELCDAARHNFRALGLGHAEVWQGDAADFLHRLPEASLIYLDPARRDAHGGRTYAISDCRPDVLLLRDELLEKADRVMLKLSPMLDWRQAVAELGQQVVSEVHVVAVGGECKELLFVLNRRAEGLRLVAVNDGDAFETDGLAASSAVVSPLPEVPFCVYEPHAALMKAGCFGELCRRFGVGQAGMSSHLFLSPRPVEAFPGRGFVVERVVSMNKKELRQVLGPLKQANITVRNFPLSVAELRKRLKLADGGDTYLLATTVGRSEHVLMICRRMPGKSA